MTAGKKPGENTGKSGGIFQQQDPRGGLLQNYVTVADNKPLPPTTQAGHTWKSVKTTPNSKK